MRKASLIAILATTITSVTAIDKIGRSSSSCFAYAVTDEAWTENNMRRRRVVYDTTKSILHYDQTMYSIGWMWSNEKEACKARTVDTVVYYNGIVVPAGAYVIDSSEILSEDGDRAHQCLLDVFRTTLGNNLNCTV
ncbi:hypothetical protein J4E91_004017 [Alternaria rosae]|nr:hypothetical protein J4E91_004017 [Alternaria rosae]